MSDSTPSPRAVPTWRDPEQERFSSSEPVHAGHFGRAF